MFLIRFASSRIHDSFIFHTLTFCRCKHLTDGVADKLRAGHSLGGCQVAYAKESLEGDTFCGRMLSMIPMTTANFAVLFPHFDNEGEALVAEIG